MGQQIRVADLAFDGKAVMTKRPGEGGYIEGGAVARVESSGDIQSRVTLTRVLLTGPFALALRKRKDNRVLFLTIEGNGWSVVRELKPGSEGDARRFAAAVNSSVHNVAGR